MPSGIVDERTLNERESDGRMRKERMLRIVGGVLVVILMGAGVVGVKLATDMKDYKAKVAETVIANVDLTQVPDGVYEGNWDMNWVAAEVAVTMEDHQMKEIRLIKHKNGKGKAAEGIIDTILAEQSLDVDVVSGATASSKAILKSVEVALGNEPTSK